MATYYGLRCRTCNTASDTWIRRNPEDVVELVKYYPVVRSVIEMNNTHPDMPWWIDIEVSYPTVEGEPPHLFLAEHYTHDLVVYDEYGRDHPEVALPKEGE